MTTPKKALITSVISLGISSLLVSCLPEPEITYPIVDTNQGTCYDNSTLIDCPMSESSSFFGQDAQYTGNTPSYTDNGDGSITDNVTNLVWTQSVSTYAMPWSDASTYCESLNTAEIEDWRLPTVKELWSIRDFSQGMPWVDTQYFYLVGDGSDNAQHHSWTSNPYLVVSDYQNEQVQDDPSWIVNDWSGHIKAMSGNRFVRCVSAEEGVYGVNDFVDNHDGTISDNATGLMWSKDDNGEAINWEAALNYAKDANLAGYNDWRLPNAKELQSLADYSGIFPVLDSTVFNLTELTNTVYDSETGNVIDTQLTYPFYWTNSSNPITSDDDSVEGGNIYAWLLASGYNPDTSGYDLHGAGSIVFDTKAEEVSDGSDVEIFYHYVRLVRGGNVTFTPEGNPDIINVDRVVSFADGDVGGSGGEGGEGTVVDFTPGVSYLAEIDILISAEELEEIIAGPPSPTAAELVENFAAEGIEITEAQAQALLDAIGLADEMTEENDLT
jgi:hypothetical protein